MLLFELESHGVNNFIWSSFLEVKDKIHLLKTSKSIRDLCIRINLEVPVIIEIKQLMNNYKNDEDSRKEIIIKLVHSFPNISKLIIRDGINGKNIFGQSLTELYNCNTIQESLKSLKVVLGDTGLAGISNLRNLLELDLSWFDFLYYKEKNESVMKSVMTFMITDIGLRELKTITNLTSLDISKCTTITDDGLSILTNLIHLNNLNLSGCREITNDCFNHMNNLTKLNHLNLDGCCKITDSGFERISNLIHLNYLHLSECQRMLTTDIGVILICRYFTKLKCLTMRRSNGVTDRSMNNLTALTNLTSLDISQCYRITDTGLDSLSELPNLTEIFINYSSRITDIGMKSISKLPNLTHLDIICCKGITDIGMNHLSKLPKLECLRYWCCDKITDIGISLFSNLKKLGDYQTLVIPK